MRKTLNQYVRLAKNANLSKHESCQNADLLEAKCEVAKTSFCQNACRLAPLYDKRARTDTSNIFTLDMLKPSAV